jgi:hypothetical protein
MKRVPIESCHTPMGLLMAAEVAMPPSPEEESDPSPATVATRYDGGSADKREMETARIINRKRNGNEGDEEAEPIGKINIC